MIQEPPGLPFSTSWIRAAQVTAGTRKGVPVIRYEGKLTEYEPGQDAIEALLSLDSTNLMRPRSDKVPVDVIAFLEQFGPLGDYFYIEDPTPMQLGADNEWTVCYLDEGFREISFFEYWDDYHSRSFKNARLDPAHLTRADIFSNGYYETWNSIHSHLQVLLLVARRLAGIEDDYYKPADSDAVDYMNGLLTQPDYGVRLRPAIKRVNGNLQWCLAFRLFTDALYGLMAQRIVGGAAFATCGPCGRLFSSHGRKYCSDTCMIEAQEIKRRNSDLLKEKARLRELLRTRVNKHGLTAAKAQEIRLAVNAAPDMTALEAVKDEYQDIFARHRRSVHSEQGRQEK